ncbi:MAG: hypothetical protein V5A68_05255 [Candidatus Thermoplasmatota archaeon]
MKLRELLVIILSFLVTLSFLSPNIVYAEEEEGNIIDSHFRIEFETATDLKVRVTMDVEKITLSASGKTYTNSEINVISNSDSEKMGAIKYALKTSTTEQIKNTFKKSKVSSVDELPIYKNNLFYDEYNVSLTSSFFNISEDINVHDFVNGLLDMGAQMNYTFYLKAEEGWNNLYDFKRPSYINWIDTNGQIDADRAEWRVNNQQGNNPENKAVLIVEEWNPTNKKEKEEVSLHFNIDTRKTNGNIFEIQFKIKQIDIAEYDVLPDFISKVRYVSADGIRLLVKNDLISWNEFYNKTMDEIIEYTIEKIEKSDFNQSINPTYKLDLNTTELCEDPFEISNMDDIPPVTAVIRAENVDIKIAGVKARALYGLLNSGAKIDSISKKDFNFGETLNEIKYEYNTTLYLPSYIKIDNKSIYSWNKNKDFSEGLKSVISKEYNEEILETTIEIDIKSADLNFFSLITGESGLNFEISSYETRKYSVVKIPEELKLPENIDIDYLNADALRVCIEEKVFRDENLNEFLKGEKKLFENHISNILSGINLEGDVNNQALRKSIDNWDGNIENLDYETPFEVNCFSHLRHPVSYNMSYIPPSFEVSNQIFNFTGLQNQEVTYKMYFPSGIDLEIINQSLDKAEVKSLKDGRKYIELTFSESESNKLNSVECRIKPSILFKIGLFTPCILAFVITLLLVAVIYIVRNKRKGGGRPPVRQQKNSGYEEKEYYVPPPPPSQE